MRTLLLAVLLQSAGGEPPREARDWLAAHGWQADEAAVSRAAAEAVARLADPGARVIEAGEADALAAAATNVTVLRDLGEGLIYLKPAAFDDTLGGLVGSGLVWSAASGAGGLILDARGAAGAGLDGVDATAGLVTAPDTFLYGLRDLGGQDLDLRSSRAGARAVLPLVMLIDGRTRGAAELLAAVLARHGGALLMGAPTAGDGVRRELLPLPDGRFLWAATAVYVRPDGTDWRGTGVPPHVRVVEEGWKRPEIVTNGLTRRGQPLDETARRHVELFAGVRHDAVLARAVDVLLGLRALALSNGDRP